MDDAVLITSELFSNSVLYSRTGQAGYLILRAELHATYLVIEVEDEGGTWASRHRDSRPHGLDIVQALAGPDNWGVETTAEGRVVWARLDLPEDMLTGTTPDELNRAIRAGWQQRQASAEQQ
jgi:anti-sigma regulatory factor (Ser/Thr protein kinase)